MHTFREYIDVLLAKVYSNPSHPRGHSIPLQAAKPPGDMRTCPGKNLFSPAFSAFSIMPHTQAYTRHASTPHTPRCTHGIRTHNAYTHAHIYARTRGVRTHHTLLSVACPINLPLSVCQLINLQPLRFRLRRCCLQVLLPLFPPLFLAFRLCLRR